MSPRTALPRSALSVVAMCALAATAAARTRDVPPDPPVPDAAVTDAALTELIERVDVLEEHLAEIDAKLGRIEELLRTIHSERLARIERLRADPDLAAAVERVEERYALSGTGDALVSGEAERLTGLATDLARAAAAHGAVEFARDPDVARLVAAMAERQDPVARGGQSMVVAVIGRDPEAVGALVEGLLDLPSTAGHEAALRAAINVRCAGLGPKLSEYAERIVPERGIATGGKDSLRLTALAAAAAYGDEDMLDRLDVAVRDLSGEGAEGGRFAYQLAAALSASGAKTAFKIYLALVLDERYAFAASQAFGRIDGFARMSAGSIASGRNVPAKRISPRESRENPTGLHAELDAWLDANWAALRRVRGRFSVRGEEQP